MRRSLLFLIIGWLVLSIPGCSTGETAGNGRVEWIIPYKEGGGSDIWARFFAPFLGKYLPEQPTVLIRNMPGGGSLKGVNWFYQQAPRDGTVIGHTSGSTAMNYLLGDSKVAYSYDDMKLIFATPTGGVLYISPKLGVDNYTELEQLRGQKLFYGSQGATSLDIVPILAFYLLDLDIKAVFGMKGRGSGRLSFERGEANVDYQTTSAYLKRVVPLIEEGLAVPIMSWGSLDESGNVVRDPTVPELPHFLEVLAHLKGPEILKTKEVQIWKSLFIAGFACQKLALLPPGTPDDIVQQWQEATRALVNDPAFREKAPAVLGGYLPIIGDKGEQLIKEALQIKPEYRQWLKDWLFDTYQVKIQ